MSLPIFYVEPTGVDAERSKITIHGDEARHLARSLRAKTGDPILVADSNGFRYSAVITGMTPDEVVADLLRAEKVEREKPAISLFQALSKQSSMDTLVLMAAEAGVDTVFPFLAERSPEAMWKNLDRLARWRRIALESSKVARRVWPLRVADPVRWPPDTGLVAGQDLLLLLWEEERTTAIRDALPARTPSRIAVFTGPEGGFSGAEVDYIRRLGAVSASMGEFILRAASAGPLAAMLIRYHYGLLAPEETAAYG
jgi:16S rRNA (uracil1498-N3)-methyltransferase